MEKNNQDLNQKLQEEQNLPEDKINKIYNGFVKGLKAEEIAQQAGCQLYEVYSCIRSAGLNFKDRGPKKTERAMEAYQLGLDAEKAAKHAKTSPNFVRLIWSQNKLNEKGRALIAIEELIEDGLEDKVELVLKKLFAPQTLLLYESDKKVKNIDLLVGYVVAILYNNPDGCTTGELTKALKQLPLKITKSLGNNLKYHIMTKLTADVATYEKHFTKTEDDIKGSYKLVWRLTEKARKALEELPEPYNFVLDKVRLAEIELDPNTFAAKGDLGYVASPFPDFVRVIPSKEEGKVWVLNKKDGSCYKAALTLPAGKADLVGKMEAR